jgi:hypothetical protein
MRTHLCALFIALGMPAFWLTINPAGLRSPLVLCLAGIELSLDDFSQEAHRIRHLTATMNPVAVVQSFHAICTGILMHSCVLAPARMVFWGVYQTILELWRLTGGACSISIVLSDWMEILVSRIYDSAYK